MMKVIVKDFLNVRVGKPSVNAPCYQYLAPGSELTVEDVLFDGDSYEGTNKWLRDGAGNYYWAGGVRDIDLPKFRDERTLLYGDNFNILFSGIDAYRNSKGKNVKIAIIDSGINLNHPVLQHLTINNKVKTINLIPGSEKDESGHGTFVAGIIAASSPLYGLNGLAPECFVVNIRATDSNTAIDSTIEKALQTAINEKVDIINLSYNINYSTYQKIIPLLQSATASNITIVAAAGNNGDLIHSKYVSSLFYPAEDESVLAVGALSNDLLRNQQEFLKSLNYLTPLETIKSCGPQNDFIEMKGCSFSTALATGVIANIVGTAKPDKQITRTEIMELLNKCCISEISKREPFNSKYELIRNA